jgi:Mitochondrial carrier protein
LCPTRNYRTRAQGFRGWYKGLTPGLITVPIFWSLYFGIYEHCKGAFKSSTGKEHHVLSAITAGAITDVM